MVPHKPSTFPVIDVSPWPFLGAAAALLLGLGLVLWIHSWGWELLALSVGLLSWTFWGWWRDMLREATPENYSTLVETVLRKGFVLFIASEVMFFVAFFWAFFDASLFPLTGSWPPQGIQTLSPFEWPYVNTLILLLSGTSLTWAHQSLLEHKKTALLRGLGCTIGLGLVFTVIQAYEYSHAAFSLKEGIYPSIFYMATGFHGLHVLIGTGFLIFCFFRAWNNQIDPDHPVGFEAACWYWQFVDVVWLFLFIAVYWWGGQT